MKKDVLVAGLLGGIVMLIWLFITNAILPIKSDMIHMIAPNQLEIHKVLKENITEPGTYSCLYLSRTEEAQMPDYRDQPVYSITYSGYTHGAGAGSESFLPLIIIFAVSTGAAWMLSVTSHKIQSKFVWRVLFVLAIGVIIALYDDIMQMSFGPQPKDYLLFLAINNLITWSLTSLIIAWRVRPAKI